ncbi:hypothetical protein GCM10027405_31440 [Arthrobacter alkaliphilus]|uniref:hypothetical protein n=1 Tax=Arthrobacter alkaliphilus TaxID=369936 RepID=UPI001F199CDB|nr:hypothetical protein [Arthrobacter alkaliphilus]
MTWPKFSDDYGDDCWGLTDAAFRLHTEALVWNGRKLLDCRIPKEDLPRFSKRPEAAGELVEKGWWTDFGSYYEILHHAQYQPTAEQVMRRQAISRKNGSNGGRPKKNRETWARPETQSGTQDETQQKTQQKTNMGFEGGNDDQATETKNPGISGRKNPAGNPSGNPEGLEAFNRSSSSVGSVNPEVERQWGMTDVSPNRPLVEGDPCSSPGCNGRLSQGQATKGSAICLDCEWNASKSRVPETV